MPLSAPVMPADAQVEATAIDLPAMGEPTSDPRPTPGMLVAGPGVPNVDTRRAVPPDPLAAVEGVIVSGTAGMADPAPAVEPADEAQAPGVWPHAPIQEGFIAANAPQITAVQEPTRVDLPPASPWTPAAPPEAWGRVETPAEPAAAWATTPATTPATAEPAAWGQSAAPAETAAWGQGTPGEPEPWGQSGAQGAGTASPQSGVPGDAPVWGRAGAPGSAGGWERVESPAEPTAAWGRPEGAEEQTATSGQAGEQNAAWGRPGEQTATWGQPQGAGEQNAAWGQAGWGGDGDGPTEVRSPMTWDQIDAAAAASTQPASAHGPAWQPAPWKAEPLGGPPPGGEAPPPASWAEQPAPAGRRGGRRLVLVGGGVAGVLLVGALAFAGYAAVSGSGSHKSAGAAPASSQPAATQGSAAPGTPQASPKQPLPAGPSIDNVHTDPKPLNLSEVFPNDKITLGGVAYKEDKTSVNHDCGLTAHGSMAAALDKAKCTSVVRATFVDGTKKFAVTAGIAVLPTKAAALTVSKAGDPAAYDWFRGMSGKVATKIDQAGGYAASTVLGRYLLYSYAQYADGTKPQAGDATLRNLSHLALDYLQPPIKARSK